MDIRMVIKQRENTNTNVQIGFVISPTLISIICFLNIQNGKDLNYSPTRINLPRGAGQKD